MHIPTEVDSLEVATEHHEIQCSGTDSTIHNTERIFAAHVDPRLSNIDNRQRHFVVKKELRLFGVLLWRYTKISTISETTVSSIALRFDHN